MVKYFGNYKMSGTGRAIKIRYDEHNDAYIVVQGNKVRMSSFLQTRLSDFKQAGIDGIQSMASGLILGIQVVNSESVKVWWIDSI